MELWLSAFRHRSQRFKVWRKGREMLLIRRLLLKSPFSVLGLPYPPADQSGSWSAMLHPKQAISLLKQVFYSRYVQPNKVVGWQLRSRNPYVPQSWDIALPLCKLRSDPTQGKRWSGSYPVIPRSMPTLSLHRLLSTKLMHWCRTHCGLLPQQYPPPELGQDLCL